MTGATERALPYFKYYSSMRLLGDHVPYPVEAWPEGGQRHLSAESALYCRVITEGLFHIVPTGFRKFSISPSLPKEWKYMRLRRIKAFERVFDIEVSRKGKQEFLIVKQQDGLVIQKPILSQQAISITLN
jgi:cellobiose phosphorylase